MQKNQKTLFRSNPTLDQLDSFVGEWDIEITNTSFDTGLSDAIKGHTSFDWLEGGAFLIQHSEIAHPDFPHTTVVIGPDEEVETYRMLYYDSRGISRIYRMALSGRIWTMWRDFPEFSQRFHATFSEDGSIITAYWDKSGDGSNWERDFDLTFTKVG